MKGAGDMAEELLYFNGINGATGEYALAPMTDADLARVILGEAPAPNLSELKQRATQTQQTYGVKAGVDPKNLAEAGWGVVFSQSDADAAAKREALSDLLKLRREQAGDRYREYFGADGVRPGEESRRFLARWRKGPGPADPDLVPYYLMLVGDPVQIPFRFQYQLDVQYAVGRLHFGSPDEFANYAHSVVLAESEGATVPRRATFFAVENDDDRATRQSATLLAQPLAQALANAKANWQIDLISGKGAGRADLEKLIAAEQAPGILFTASHGMCFPKGDPRQVTHQGALLCADWPGPNEWHGPIPPDQYFSADNVGQDACLLGRVFFHFGCYTAGTPQVDDFSRDRTSPAAQLAEADFVSQLGQRVLGRPGGGAIAVIGHIDRAWSCSFFEQGAGEQVTSFESTLTQLMDGLPVGACTEYFNERYAELSTLLVERLDDVAAGKSYSSQVLASNWAENRDARNYIVLGDPAARLSVSPAA